MWKKDGKKFIYPVKMFYKNCPLKAVTDKEQKDIHTSLEIIFDHYKNEYRLTQFTAMVIKTCFLNVHYLLYISVPVSNRDF